MAAIRLLRLTGFAVLLFLVSSVSAQTPAGLEFSNPRFKQQPNMNFNPRFSVSKSGNDADDYLPGETRPPTGTHEKNIYSTTWSSKAEATAHNTGSKTIRKIIWEYIFFADASMSQVARGYRIQTKKKLAPGETKTLKATIPGRELSPYQTVRPLRIEYTDGTIWQSP